MLMIMFGFNVRLRVLMVVRVIVFFCDKGEAEEGKDC